MDAFEKASLAWSIVLNRRAQDPLILDLRALTSITDYFVICTGNSRVHIQALVDALREDLETRGFRPLGLEGYEDAHWALLDFGDVVIHVFAPEEREYYALERLWGDAPRPAPVDELQK